MRHTIVLVIAVLEELQGGWTGFTCWQQQDFCFHQSGCGADPTSYQTSMSILVHIENCFKWKTLRSMFYIHLTTFSARLSMPYFTVNHWVLESKYLKFPIIPYVLFMHFIQELKVFCVENVKWQIYEHINTIYGGI
jgi:hypothetical protein